MWPVRTRHPTGGKALQCVEIPGPLGAYTYAAQERSKSSSKRYEGAMNSEYALPSALPSAQKPIYLSRPGVGGLAGTSVHVRPQGAEAGGGAAVGSHRGRVLAAHEKAEGPARVPPVPPRSTQLPRAVKLLPQVNILSHLFSTLLVQQSMGWGG